jgi:hypothetical protein
MKKFLLGFMICLFSVVAIAQEPSQEMVSFNNKTKKYHCLSCPAAIKCTRNCNIITIKKAHALGGIPCRKCGGKCQ